MSLIIVDGVQDFLFFSRKGEKVAKGYQIHPNSLGSLRLCVRNNQF
jgi:hypothetical protein